MNWDRQARVLGYGYQSRRKSFDRMRNALQVVYLGLLAKADFNTDILRLRPGSPRDFNKVYLEIF
jgi:hypothetical protein